MKSIHRYRIAAISFTILSTILMSLDTQAGPSVTVINTNSSVVVNTSANPVPVTLQGTPVVSGSVTINGTPNVNVANTPTVHLASDASVQIGNATTALVPVREVATSVNQPFQFYSAVSLSGSGADVRFTVPAGKRFFIEYVSGSAGIGSISRVLIRIGVIDVHGTFTFIDVTHTVPVEQGNNFGRVVKMYADPGRTIEGEIQCSDCSDSGANADIALTGYLVDVP
jgi:hypothetical protein